MEKELIKALEKLEKLVTDGIIESYELHRDKKTFNSYVSAKGSLKEWGSCEVSAWLYEIDDIPQVIKNKLMF